MFYEFFKYWKKLNSKYLVIIDTCISGCEESSTLEAPGIWRSTLLLLPLVFQAVRKARLSAGDLTEYLVIIDTYISGCDDVTSTSG